MKMLMGSVPHKMDEALQSVSALIRNRTQLEVSRLTVTHLNHKAIGLYQWLYDLSYFTTCTNFFAYMTVILGFFKLNIKARHEIRESLNANL